MKMANKNEPLKHGCCKRVIFLKIPDENVRSRTL